MVWFVVDAEIGEEFEENREILLLGLLMLLLMFEGEDADSYVCLEGGVFGSAKIVGRFNLALIARSTKLALAVSSPGATNSALSAFNPLLISEMEIEQVKNDAAEVARARNRRAGRWCCWLSSD